MRLPFSSNAVLQHLVKANAPAAPAPIAPADGLIGLWSATRWQYIALGNPSKSVDLVSELGGMVAVSLSLGAFILVADVGDLVHDTVIGTFTVADGEIRFTEQGGTEPVVVRFYRMEKTLALQSVESAWDFDGDGIDEPAEFVAVLVRL
jgi:hypothetical protein